MAVEPYIVPIGGNIVPEFPAQFAPGGSELSWSTTPIEYLNHEQEPVAGLHSSGLICNHRNRTFLVTARHCLSGRNTFTDELLDKKNGYIPPFVKIFPTYRLTDRLQRTEQVVSTLCENGDPYWIQDPDFDNLKTDIACLPLPDVHLGGFDGERVVYVGQALDDPLADMFAHSGAACFVNGYPNANYAAPFFPIWRRATFAYEPSAPIDNKPIFLVDAMTSKGMSGSPIYQCWFGPLPTNQDDGSLRIKADNVVATRFIGIYGGRLEQKNNVLAEIGYGWYANRVQIMLDAYLKN